MIPSAILQLNVSDDPAANLPVTLALLKEEDTAVLLVTHEPDEAMRMADEIALMRDGRIVQQGATQAQSLRLPFGHLVGQAIGERLQADPSQLFTGTLVCLAQRASVQLEW